MIAIGIGCRKGCPADDIVALVRDALAELESRTNRAGDGLLWERGDEDRATQAGNRIADAGRQAPRGDGRAQDLGMAAGLFSIAEKRDEAGLAEAALCLGLPLTFLDDQDLRRVADKAQSRSARVEAMYGLPSIAETAALAGAGTGAVLLVARKAAARATCAIAGPPG